jgi:penicillin-binding protein 1A
VTSDGAFQRWSLRQVPEVQGAFMAMDVNTGRVLAMQGGFSYQHSVFNRATQAQRQPGLGLQALRLCRRARFGLSPGTIVIDAPIEVETAGRGIWRPTNASNQFYGPTPVRTGIEMSRNLMTVRLAQEVGMDVVAAYAERFGVYDRMQPFSPMRWARRRRRCSAWSRPMRCSPMAASGWSRRWSTGCRTAGAAPSIATTSAMRGLRPSQALPRADAAHHLEPERVMDPITAYQLTSMLEGVIQRGTASRVNLPVPIAGKTGTTNDARDVWFVGFTSNIVAGCYIGYDRPRRWAGASRAGACAARCSRSSCARRSPSTAAAASPCRRAGISSRSTAFRRAAARRRLGEPCGGRILPRGRGAAFGLAHLDGGFAMGSNLPLFHRARRRGRAMGGGRSATGRPGRARTPGGFRHAQFRRALLRRRPLPPCRAAIGRPAQAPDIPRGSPMRAETQNTVEAIRKSLRLLAQRMDGTPRRTGWRSSTP